jgi:hypothetical protein
MNKVKEFCGETNKFKPNESLFNQEGASLFGSIRLFGFSCMNSLKSQILKGEQQLSELLKLCEFLPNDKWSLLYRGTRDGFDSNDFHSKCDGHANTLTIFKAEQSEFIFGGYTTVAWESCSKSGKWKSDPNAFIFSLTNKDNTPLQMKIDPNQQQCAIFCHSECGPSFGKDILIANNANTTMNSCYFMGVAINILNMQMEQMKLKHFWLDHLNFNWMKLKSMKKDENF